MIVIFSADALEDLSSILAYLAERNPKAADRIGRRLVEAADKIAPFPHSGRWGLRDGTREIATVWPYVIVYRVTETEVQILGRRPWRHRVGGLLGAYRARPAGEWSVPERMAAATLRLDRWEAGALLMQDANPQGWAQLIQASRSEDRRDKPGGGEGRSGRGVRRFIGSIR